MQHLTNHRLDDERATTPTPAIRREGSVMGAMRNPKRLLIAAVTIAGLTGGAMVAHADPFRSRAYENAAVTGDVLVPQNLASATPVWPSLPSTCTIEQRDTGTCDVSLVAGAGLVDLTDGGATASLPFWGFGVNGAPVALPGATGSVIKVPQGTVIHVALTQEPGTGSPIDLTFPSLANVVDNGDGTYDVTADHVGTMVFQPGTTSASTGLDAPRQVAMGMVGVLIVTPVAEGTPEVLDTDGNVVTPAVPAADCSACAYDTATTFDDEALVALSTIDASFANAPFGDISYFGQSRDAEGNTRKVYHLINGKAFPDTDVIDVREGDSLLLRYVNAGVEDHNMGLLGLRQSVLGANTDQYSDPEQLVAPRVGPGETLDVAVTIPTVVAEGQKYSLMDQGRGLNGATAEGFGGALTFIDVWTGTAPTIDPPTFDLGTSAVSTTAHPSPGHGISGYQTLVTDTDVPPADADWPIDPVVIDPVVIDTDAPIAAAVTADAGQFVWVRAQQDTGVWTAPVSVQVPAPALAVELPTVTIDSLASSVDRTVSISATAPAGATISSVEAGFGDTNPPTDWTAVVTGSDPYVVSGADHHGEELWVRATDSNGNVSIAVHATIPLNAPTVTAQAFDGSTLTLTATGTIDPAAAASPATVQWAISATTPDGTTTWTDGTGPADAISETIGTAVNGDKVWVRIVDAKGTMSAPVSVDVVIP